MTKKLILTTLLTVLSAVSFAQMDEYEIETVEKNISAGNAESLDDYKSSNSSKDSDGSPQINIYNANSNANKQAQKAKQEAAQRSDVDSMAQAEAGSEYVVRANEIRNNRKNMEVGTEQKMIEKIEWSRIEDEKERADRLFGNRLEQKKQARHDDEEDIEIKQKVVIVEKPVVYSAPAKAENVVETESVESWWGQESYISPVAGSTSYDADNISGDMAIGVTLGTRLDSNVSLEGGFLYSDYEMVDYTVGQIGNPGLKDVTQYNFLGAVKYNFDIGRVNPHVGALLGYTYREFDETKLTASSATSSAFDAGLSAGADVKIAQNFSIGAEYRWMRNITYDRSEDGPNNVIPQQAVLGKTQTPMEEVGYQMFLVNGKFTF